MAARIPQVEIGHLPKPISRSGFTLDPFELKATLRKEQLKAFPKGPETTNTDGTDTKRRGRFSKSRSAHQKAAAQEAYEPPAEEVHTSMAIGPDGNPYAFVGKYRREELEAFALAHTLIMTGENPFDPNSSREAKEVYAALRTLGNGGFA